MKASRFVFIALVLAGLLAAPAGGALAQESRFSVQARGGLVIPVGHDLYSDPGASFGGDFTYWVTEDFGLRAAGDVNLLSGAPASELTGPVDAPDMNLYHFRGGFVFRALNPEASPWTLDFDALGGMSTISIDELPASLGFEESSLSETYAAASGGVQVGYAFNERIDGFLSGQVYYVPTDKDDFQLFGRFDPMNPESETFTDIWTVPIRGGISINF